VVAQWRLQNKEIGKLMLRRTREDAGIVLPALHIHPVIRVPWESTSERDLAETIHSLCPRQTHVQPVAEAVVQADMGAFADMGVLANMSLARQFCVLPRMVSRRQSQPGFVAPGIAVNAGWTSKMHVVLEYLFARKDNGRGKIVFCQFHSEIDFLLEHLAKPELQFKRVLAYDERTSKHIRLDRDIADILLIQVQTGNEGLNLQEHYSEVYFVSPNWNPCIQQQAIARCYRVGQTQEVHVFQFAMAGFSKRPDQIQKPISMDTYALRVQKRKLNEINFIHDCINPDLEQETIEIQ